MLDAVNFVRGSDGPNSSYQLPGATNLKSIKRVGNLVLSCKLPSGRCLDKCWRLVNRYIQRPGFESIRLKPFIVTDQMNDEKWRALKLFPHPNIMRVFDYDSRSVYAEYLADAFPLYNPVYMSFNMLHEAKYKKFYQSLYASTVFYIPHKCKHPLDVDQLGNQILSAFQHLHKHCIFHADVKPNNVLVIMNSKNEPVPKIIDFEGSIKVRDSSWIDFKRDLVWLTRLLGGLSAFKPFFIKLDARGVQCNYCHFVRDVIFPLFVHLHKIGRADTFCQNIFYCSISEGMYSKKSDWLHVFTDNPIVNIPYDNNKMRLVNIDHRQSNRNTDLTHQYMQMFVKHVYGRFNITACESKSLKLITLVDRNDASCRHILNFDRVCKAVRNFCLKHKLELRVVKFENLSVRDQVALLAQTKIFIALHGAALINAPFISHSGTVIEILPYGFSYNSFVKFASGRSDVKYIQWTVDKKHSVPTISSVGIDMSKTIVDFPELRKDARYRGYWRDQNVIIDIPAFLQVLMKYI